MNMFKLITQLKHYLCWVDNPVVIFMGHQNWKNCIAVKSFNFMGTKCRGLKTFDMFVNT